MNGVSVDYRVLFGSLRLEMRKVQKISIPRQTTLW